ncbi:hypothetical protein FA09DRAFT_71084 [Tilletiopsis washingtonensis]|uniref:Uncharacterized protein n=1 Tax=Tilletiopsis washingtonensis TaxID=58919 RepID=A0A316Z539_9BASI|nr:hypothetical protein FA09DRAFT_71084 [Tilletiopsis washingtonensis]PWN96887.1 hypothetical protein FA09DRAFT_71084 [Tilletiopsis washingtonensis]
MAQRCRLGRLRPPHLIRGRAADAHAARRCFHRRCSWQNAPLPRAGRSRWNARAKTYPRSVSGRLAAQDAVRGAINRPQPSRSVQICTAAAAVARSPARLGAVGPRASHDGGAAMRVPEPGSPTGRGSAAGVLLPSQGRASAVTEKWVL